MHDRVQRYGLGADGKDYPGLQLFVQANKAVFIAEYQNHSASAWSSICSTSRAQHFNTSLYTLGLPTNGGRAPCATGSPTTWSGSAKPPERARPHDGKAPFRRPERPGFAKLDP